MDDRDFRLMSKFSGDMNTWDNWKHAFLLCFYKVPELYEALVSAVRQAGETADFSEIRIEPGIKNMYRAAVYRFLIGTTEGEAQTIVRSVMDRGAAVHCGFGALALLAQRYDPRTPGRILQQWGSVLDPGKIKDVRHLQQHIEAWEAKRTKLMVGYKEQLSDTLSIAILAKMLPRDLQDIVYQTGKIGEALVYREVRDKIMAIAAHRAFDMSVPQPMDIGSMEDENIPEENPEEAAEVDAISSDKQCYNCSGWGHAASECPSAPRQKGKGKGNNNGNGGSSNNVSGKSNNQKGTGKSKTKGYQGVCFRCQQKGHSANNCTAPAPVKPRDIAQVGPEQPAVVANVGGVWSLCSVSRPHGRGRRHDHDHDRDPDHDHDPDHDRDPDCQETNPKRQVKFIGSVDEKGGLTEITVDSAADESVCPTDWGKHFGLSAVANDQRMQFVNASGGKIQHYGSRRVVVQSVSGENLAMRFQVTDVRKPLLAVSRLCEQGNCVRFGPSASDNYIENVASGQRLQMERRGNSWVIPGKLAEAGF